MTYNRKLIIFCYEYCNINGIGIGLGFPKLSKFPGNRGRWMLDQVVQYKNSSIIRLNSSKDDFQTVGKDRKKKILSDLARKGFFGQGNRASIIVSQRFAQIEFGTIRVNIGCVILVSKIESGK